MHMHHGMTTLRLSVDGKQLTGDYYSGRDRGNVGTLQAVLVDRALLDKPTALSRLAGASSPSLPTSQSSGQSAP
jgi:hypothetical protein